MEIIIDDIGLVIVLTFYSLGLFFAGYGIGRRDKDGNNDNNNANE